MTYPFARPPLPCWRQMSSSRWSVSLSRRTWYGNMAAQLLIPRLLAWPARLHRWVALLLLMNGVSYCQSHPYFASPPCLMSHILLVTLLQCCWWLAFTKCRQISLSQIFRPCSLLDLGSSFFAACIKDISSSSCIKAMNYVLDSILPSNGVFKSKLNWWCIVDLVQHAHLAVLLCKLPEAAMLCLTRGGSLSQQQVCQLGKKHPEHTRHTIFDHAGKQGGACLAKAGLGAACFRLVCSKALCSPVAAYGMSWRGSYMQKNKLPSM